MSLDTIIKGTGIFGVIAFIVLCILSLVSVGYLTALSFEHKKWEDLNKDEINLLRANCVLYWIFVGLFIILAGYALYNKEKVMSSFNNLKNII
jgi:hypothetical protein